MLMEKPAELDTLPPYIGRRHQPRGRVVPAEERHDQELAAEKERWQMKVEKVRDRMFEEIVPELVARGIGEMRRLVTTATGARTCSKPAS